MASQKVVIYVAYCVKDQFFVDHCVSTTNIWYHPIF